MYSLTKKNGMEKKIAEAFEKSNQTKDIAVSSCVSYFIYNLFVIRFVYA